LQAKWNLFHPVHFLSISVKYLVSASLVTGVKNTVLSREMLWGDKMEEATSQGQTQGQLKDAAWGENVEWLPETLVNKEEFPIYRRHSLPSSEDNMGSLFPDL
jgi:hypothetical protein